jgi:hypothetical protein
MKDKHMSANIPCSKLLLAGNDGCRVTYCETHQTTELEIGAFSLRLDVEAFSTLNHLINEASTKINALHASQQSYNHLIRKLKDTH